MSSPSTYLTKYLFNNKLDKYLSNQVLIYKYDVLNIFSTKVSRKFEDVRFFEGFTGLKFASKIMLQKIKVFPSRVLSNLSNYIQIFVKISNENEKVCM